MDTHRFDRVTKIFAERRLSRREALAKGGAGIAAGVLGAAGFKQAIAQDSSATPEAAGAGEQTFFLFVQSFRSGSIAAKDGEMGAYTVTLEQGTGQTVYFADRPSRDVGAVPTGPFLDGLGFPEDNPPNAALVVETAPGETDIAVVELLNPVVADDGAGVTYDVQVLANWEDSVEWGFSQAPIDLAALAPTFGAAHLFIDDCADRIVTCLDGNRRSVGTLGPTGYCYHWDNIACIPCNPYGGEPETLIKTHTFWSDQCNTAFAGCEGSCASDFGNLVEFGH